MNLLTTSQAARTAHVTPERIRDWRRRQLLEPADYDRRGWPLYRTADVMKVERRTWRDHRGHRRPLEAANQRQRNAARRLAK